METTTQSPDQAARKLREIPPSEARDMALEVLIEAIPYRYDTPLKELAKDAIDAVYEIERGFSSASDSSPLSSRGAQGSTEPSPSANS